MLFVERRDGKTVPIDTRQFPGVQHGYAHTEYREQGSTRYAELHLVGQHVNQRSLVVGMTRHTHRYGMHYSAEAVGSFENLGQFGERSRDKVSLAEFAVRDLAAEQREAQKQAKLQAAIERQREAAAERIAERERNATMAFAIELPLHERGIRTISREDIFKIMPEVACFAGRCRCLCCAAIRMRYAGCLGNRRGTNRRKCRQHEAAAMRCAYACRRGTKRTPRALASRTGVDRC